MSRRALLALALALLACSDEKAEERAPASGATAPLTLQGLLAHPFRLIKEGGARALPPREKTLLPGFGVTVRQLAEGGAIALTASGLRLRSADLEPPLLSPFEGVELTGGKLELAWVVRAGAPVQREPSASARLVARRERLSLVALLERDGPVGWYRTREGWMREADLAVPARSSRPGEVGPEELWLDVHLPSQTLVVYRGDRPIFATLVSAGVGAPGSAFATPTGTHRITGKRLMTPMSNLEHRGVVYYFYEEVPLAQFLGRVSLHGVYWHDGFGQARSHGCINLSLRDAFRLFSLSEPRLPRGQSEVAAAGRGGTVVRVR